MDLNDNGVNGQVNSDEGGVVDLAITREQLVRHCSAHIARGRKADLAESHGQSLSANFVVEVRLSGGVYGETLFTR